MSIQVRMNSHKDEFLKAEEEAIDRAMEMIGLQMEGYAKEALTASKAVDTGRLRGSVTYATVNSHSSGQSPAEGSDYATHGTPERGEVVIGTNVEYAPYIEFGTSKMAARPYLRNTVQGHHDEYRAMILSQLRG